MKYEKLTKFFKFTFSNHFYKGIRNFSFFFESWHHIYLLLNIYFGTHLLTALRLQNHLFLKKIELMLAFSKTSSDDTQGYEDPRMQEYAPDESDASQLVWNIPPSKRYFKPCDSYMTFSVELPETVVPDNGFVDKCFDGMNIEIQQDLVTSKNADSESAITGYFWRKSMFDQNYLDSTMSLVGCFDIHNVDSTILKKTPQIIAGRRLNAKKFFKKIEIGEVTYNTIWYRYEFISPLNHGLAREPCCLPANLEICLKLYRAPSSAAVMKIADQITCDDGTKIDYDFSDSFIELRRPRLCAMFLRSEKLDAKMAKYRS